MHLLHPQLPRSQNNRRHFYDFRYFSVIDTEPKAYWLGFIMADGCVYKNRLSIGLAIRDINHLKAFAEAVGLQGEPPVTLRESTHSCHLVLSCQQMVTDLATLGCLPRKTYHLDFPGSHQVPPHLMHHFVRGYFDGDGGLTLSRRGHQCQVVILGLETFIADMRTHVGHYGGVYPKNVVVEWRFSGKEDVQRFYDYIYRDATVRLSRKKERFEEHFRLRLPQRVKLSRYVGVSYDVNRQKWTASASEHNHTIHLGRFLTEELAYQSRCHYDQNRPHAGI